jgi:hypothetical protein
MTPDPDIPAVDLDELIVEGYQRMPQGEEFDVDEWGDLGVVGATMSADQMRLLNEDEREAGLDPW